MKRIFFVVVALLALFAVALGQMKVNQTTQASNSEEELMRFERDWADAFLRRERGVLKQYLADDFRLTTGDGVSDRAQFLESAEHDAAGFSSIDLSARSMRLYGDTAVSNGIATFKTRTVGGASEPAEIRGEAATATGSAVVNVAELSREEAVNPSPHKQKAIHPPMSTPDNLQPPRDAATAPDATNVQYRYTAVYVRRQGRWQAVALQLTRTRE